MTFDSPQSAYEYINPGQVKLVVAGKETDFTIGQDDGKYIYLIVPKTSDKCKLGLGAEMKTVTRKYSDDISIYVYQYKSSPDYYITVWNMNSEELKISDSCNSQFSCLEKPIPAIEKTYYTYYAYI